jgi:hypothetical protein
VDGAAAFDAERVFLDALKLTCPVVRLLYEHARRGVSDADTLRVAQHPRPSESYLPRTVVVACHEGPFHVLRTAGNRGAREKGSDNYELASTEVADDVVQ